MKVERYKISYQDQLDLFLKLVQERANKHYVHQYDSLMAPNFINEGKGRKYDKIISVGKSQRSVWAFIEKSTGAIYKAASWYSPAKHARGNIFNTDPLKGTGIYGPDYMK